MRHETKAQTTKSPVQRLFDLWWLGYLLTGDRDLSVDAVAGTLDADGAANPVFRTFMIAWSRKLVIAKVLGNVQAELKESAHRTKTRLSRRPLKARGRWHPDRTTGKAELERALLTIDIFPRCALLLTVFERLPKDDVAILLNGDRELVTTAVAVGITELVEKLAQGGSVASVQPDYIEPRREMAI